MQRRSIFSERFQTYRGVLEDLINLKLLLFTFLYASLVIVQISAVKQVYQLDDLQNNRQFLRLESQSHRSLLFRERALRARSIGDQSIESNNTTITNESNNNNNNNINLIDSQTKLINSNSTCRDVRQPAVFGLRCDDRGDIINGELTIKANEITQVTLIGQNLELNFSLALTPIVGDPGDDCTHLDRIKSVLVLTYVTPTIAQVDLNLPSPGSHVPYYMCIREIIPNTTQRDEPWCHQGSHHLVRLYVHQDFLPLYMKLIVIFCLLMFSGLFSGLNLGLMALDKNELQVIISCGTEKEKRYARAIEPVRRRGNYLLCSILFSNVLVNSTIAVLLEELTSGIVAVMVSTIFIVMFGEILPQAFCSRHGLAVSAKTVFITYLCMIVTAPLSYPVSACLDWALGEEISHAYDRERLVEFIRITRDYNNLDSDEVNIIAGALKLKRANLAEVMTRIEDVFMLDINSNLDFDTIKSIVEQGYSRIPVHEPNNKRHILALLFAKDLALLDPDDRTPVQTLISFYNHPVVFMFEDTSLHSALTEFKIGKSHMAFIRRVIDDGDRDPVYELTGIVTLEDVIEEILQMEINDETDTVTDNRRRRRRKEAQVRSDFAQFTRHQLDAGDSSYNVCVTPQLCLAAYQFLSTNVEPFSKKYINDSILKRLLAQKIYHRIRLDSADFPGSESSSSSIIQMSKQTSIAERERVYLYKSGEVVDHFIMILEGRVSVICGREELNYEAGPFSYFGKSSLTITSATLDALGAQPARRMVTSNKSVQPAYELKQRQILSSYSSDEIARSTIHGSNLKIKQASILDDTKTMGGQEHNAIGDETYELNLVNPSKWVKLKASLESIATSERENLFIPDYTVRAISDIIYLKIGRQDYLSALRATLFEQSRASFGGPDKHIQTSVVSGGSSTNSAATTNININNEPVLSSTNPS